MDAGCLQALCQQRAEFRAGRIQARQLGLEFLVGSETVAVVRPSPYRLPTGSPTSGQTELRWLIPALPETTGEVSLRLTLSCAGSQLAVAEIPSLHLLRGEVVDVDGEATVVHAEGASVT